MKLLAVCACATALTPLAFPRTTAAAESAPVVEAKTMTLALDTKTAEVEVCLQNNPGIIGLNISVSYDDAAVELTNVTDSNLLTGAMHSPTYEKNPYTLIWMNDLATENFSEDVVLATLTFSIKDGWDFTPLQITLDVEEAFNFDLQDLTADFIPKSGSISHTHTFGEWQADTNEHHRSCACGISESGEHENSDWIIDTAPSEGVAGSQHKECVICGYTTKTETIPALPLSSEKEETDSQSGSESASKEESGCSSALGSSLTTIGIALAAAGGFVFTKKKVRK